MADDGPRIRAGERLSLMGRSGSGKTYLGRWFMARSGLKWVVLDTKHDPAFDKYVAKGGLLTMQEIARAFKERTIVVVRPNGPENKPPILDAYLNDLHEAFENFGINIDETYQVALGSRPGPGLTGLITRGRVRGQAVICGSQRPSWVPRFCFSEANYFAVMSLNTEDDREKITSFTGDERMMEKLAQRKWWWYNVGDDELVKYGAVTLEERKAK